MHFAGQSSATTKRPSNRNYTRRVTSLQSFNIETSLLAQLHDRATRNHGRHSSQANTPSSQSATPFSPFVSLLFSAS